jgi:FMN phosphatase YigB (HAD superfamily)
LSVENLRAIAEQLCRDILQNVQVMEYNAVCEKVCIKELLRMFPDLKGHLLAIHENFIDLMAPFRSKHLQTPEMDGSYSIKYVLPALIPELAYSDLEVQNGEMACETFKSLQNLSPEERTEKRNALLAYCKMDTFALVKILKKLEEMCSG